VNEAHIILLFIFLLGLASVSLHFAYKRLKKSAWLEGYGDGWEVSLASSEDAPKSEVAESEDSGEPTVPQSLVNQILEDTKAAHRAELDKAVADVRRESENWKREEEKKIRADAVKRSKNVIKGKTTEHLVPYMEDFDYNPSDCRFLGSPIDIIVFDGLSDGDVKEVVFLEIKTGKSASLSSRERKVRDALKEKRVSWRLIRKNDQ
jgi:predicted Holliday junction resolvase-like endonuclease